VPVWVIVVAAGRGERFGAPKQFALLRGRPVLQWSVDAARAVADGVVLVLPPGLGVDGAAGDRHTAPTSPWRVGRRARPRYAPASAPCPDRRR